MRLCEVWVKSGGMQKISSDILFANVRIRCAIRTYGPNSLTVIHMGINFQLIILPSSHYPLLLSVT